ncbi:MAG: hypothetical protein HUU30_15355 [Burkholderiaceae bacterium]|nr:hypothetical protein [Burkholderiaceae bacterium]
MARPVQTAPHIPMHSASASPLKRRALLAAAAGCALPAWPLGAAAAAARAAMKVPRPPVARVEPVTETFFGQSVTDPYRWMENPKDKDWEPFMRGQDAHARATLAAIPGRDALAQRISSLSAGTAIAYGVQRAGQGSTERVFYQVRPAGADGFQLAVRAGLGAPERILIDPTAMKDAQGRHVSLDWWVPSPDGRHVVYGLSAAGSEDSVLHVMEVDSLRVLPERVAGTQYAGPSWLPDSSGFFYARVADPAARGSVEYYKRSPVWLHRLGTDAKDDVLQVVHGRDPALPLTETEFPSIQCSPVSTWAVLVMYGGVRRENPLFVAPLADVVAGRAKWRPVCAIADEVTGFAFDATDLYLLTTRDSPNGRVLRLPLDGGTYATATPVVPEGPRVIEGFALARDGLYLLELDGGYHALRKLGRDGRDEFFGQWRDDILAYDRQNPIARVAAYWAMTEKFLEHSYSGYQGRVVFVSYEELAQQREPLFTALLTRLGFQPAQENFRVAGDDSTTTSDSQRGASIGERVSGWKSFLSPPEIAAIEAIVQRFGLENRLVNAPKANNFLRH